MIKFIVLVYWTGLDETLRSFKHHFHEISTTDPIHEVL